ncbi:MAG: hypothetical protein KAG12_04210, partial [Desulfuromusa sp.]|nr:hypothetical protein [Desulfuromusa sp.]
MTTRTRAMLSMMILLSIICAIFLSMLYQQTQKNLQQLVKSKSTESQLVAKSILDHTSQQYRLRIKSFVNYKASGTREQLIKAFAERDRDLLQKLSKPLLDVLKKENPYLDTMGWILPDNKVFLRVHAPHEVSKSVKNMRPDVAAVNVEKVQISGFMVGIRGLQYRVVQPIFFEGRYLGAVQIGIDAKVFMEGLRQKNDINVGFSVPKIHDKKHFLEKFGAKAYGDHIVYSTNSELFEKNMNEINWESSQQTIMSDNRSYVFNKILPLNDFQNEKVGCLFIAIDTTDMVADVQKSMFSAAILSLALLLSSYVILHFSFGALIEKIVGLNKSLENSNLDLEKRVEERTKELVQETEERKNTEEKLHRAEKMEAIGLMASGVAHDLNNILSGVISYPELLLMRLPEDSKLRLPITSIKESGLRAAAVVADLLTVARDAAKVRAFTDINTLILEYLQSPEAASLQELNSEVVITTQLAADLPKVCCSPTHVNKCIMNLVMNATESFSTAGEVKISSSVLSLSSVSMPEVSLAPGDYIIVTVEDNGSGISAEDLSHIFEPFYTKKEMGRSGTGIGLAVVWNCMEDHGGAVTVKSTEQQGTTFSLLFPVGRGEEECHAGISSRGDTDFKGHGETILVVDDEAHQRDIAVQVLDELGYRAEAVNCGEDAIAYVKEHRVDL